jgi:hypothetical protein
MVHRTRQKKIFLFAYFLEIDHSRQRPTPSRSKTPKTNNKSKQVQYIKFKYRNRKQKISSIVVGTHCQQVLPSIGIIWRRFNQVSHHCNTVPCVPHCCNQVFHRCNPVTCVPRKITLRCDSRNRIGNYEPQHN